MKIATLSLLALTLAALVVVPEVKSFEVKSFTMCRSSSGFVVAREGGCKPRETQILDKTGGNVCPFGYVLVGGGRCVSINDLVAAATCGNAIVEPGEQCDLGPDENADDGVCTTDCKWNCPCDFFSTSFLTWQAFQSVDWVDTTNGPKQCILNGNPPLPVPDIFSIVYLDSQSYGSFCTNFTTIEEVAVNYEPLPSDDVEEACGSALAQYANLLNANGIAVDGVEPFVCTLP